MENKVNPVMRHISFGSGEKTMVIVPGLPIVIVLLPVIVFFIAVQFVG